MAGWRAMKIVAASRSLHALALKSWVAANLFPSTYSYPGHVTTKIILYF